MKYPFHARAPAYDAQAIHLTIQRALASAGLDTTSPPLRGLTETLRRALGAGSFAGAGSESANASVIDVVARTVDTDEAAQHTVPAPRSTPVRTGTSGVPGAAGQGRQASAAQAAGSFESHSFTNPAGTRAYKLYVPAGVADAPRAMLVMLHGCTQSADDFATGTQMNRLADAHGFLVAYPEQSAQANTSKCWNWFKPQDQGRDAGEPSVIAGIVQEIVGRHDADPQRIFVAGLSAGAAMAVTLGQTYPDMFAGVGAHSGLPYGSAHDVASALAAMKGGRSGLAASSGMAKKRSSMPIPEAANTWSPSKRKTRRADKAVPTIVFHGDRDHTVQQINAAQIAQQAQDAFAAQTAASGAQELQVRTVEGTATGGRKYSRTVHADAQGLARVELWTLHGAGHAWSGGDPGGSYTDASGPDASAEMLRFFLALPPRPAV